MNRQEQRLAELERRIDGGIHYYTEATGNTPTIFIDMKFKYGVKEACRRLVESGDLQSGFLKMIKLGLSHWTCEQAVIDFKDLFPPRTVECAKYRLLHPEGKVLKPSRRFETT